MGKEKIRGRIKKRNLKIYVIGEAITPGNLNFSKTITLLEAVLLCFYVFLFWIPKGKESQKIVLVKKQFPKKISKKEKGCGS